VALIAGPSGGGKSTLLRCCLGLVPRFYGGDFSGTVYVQGEPIGQREPHQLATSVGMVFQNPEDQVIASIVRDDVAFGPENLGLPLEELRERTVQAMRLAGIEALAGATTRELSAGQLQKVALAGILALGPDILCLDEPTSQIDPASAQEIIELVGGLARHSGKTVLLAEHRLEFAAAIADRLVVVAEGRIMADGTPREVLAMAEAPGWGLGRPKAFDLALRLKALGRWPGQLPLTAAEFTHQWRR
jgi:energy-coupling factor transporter ATP-binding protein EcfA2